MSFGKPVIAPRIGCIKDFLDFSGGILYNPRQENALSETLLEAMISKSKLSEMGQYNSVIASNYSWTKTSAATCSVYETVVKK
jgi:glycosyltransferase involved in cell wall biosynthesis